MKGCISWKIYYNEVYKLPLYPQHQACHHMRRKSSEAALVEIQNALFALERDEWGLQVDKKAKVVAIKGDQLTCIKLR